MPHTSPWERLWLSALAWLLDWPLEWPWDWFLEQVLDWCLEHILDRLLLWLHDQARDLLLCSLWSHSISLWRASAVSNALWPATQRALHNIPVGPIHPFYLLRVWIFGCGKKCPPLQSNHQGGEYILNSTPSLSLSTGGVPLGTSLKGTHYGICLSSPSWIFGSLLAPWQIGLPRIRFGHTASAALAEHVFCLFLAPALQCGGTFHAAPLTSGEFPDPTGGTHPERAGIHHLLWLPKGYSPFLLPLSSHLAPLHTSSVM